MSETLERDTEEAAIIKRIEDGELFEHVDELTPGYRKALEEVIHIAAISEVTVLTWAYTAYETAPDIGAKIAVCATIQDEVGHAHQQGFARREIWHRHTSRRF